MKKSTVILIWGGGTGIASVIFYQILYAFDMQGSSVKAFSLLLLFLGLFIGTFQFRTKANGSYLSFGEGFKTSFLMSLIATAISTIDFIINLQLHPDFIDKIIEQQRNKLINTGMDEQQIEMGLHFTRLLSSPSVLILTSIIGGLLFGLIFSLITAGISTREKPFFEDANDEINPNS